MFRSMFAAVALSLAAAVPSCSVAIAQTPAAEPGPVTATEWKAMLAAAKPGSVLDLGDREVQFARAPAADITIRGGRFRDVVLDSWRNVTFDGSRFAIEDNQGQLQFLVIAYSPQGLTFRDCDFVGTDLNGTLQVRSLSIRQGSNVTVTGSRFTHLANFIGFTGTDGVVFEDNDLSDIREGIQIAGAQNVSIRFNRIGPFRPAAGDHADGIQFFTTGLKLAARHVLIEGNLIVSAPGHRAQGVLIGDEAKLSQVGAGYQDFTIRANMLVGTGWHGISATAPVDGLAIEGNTLLRVDGGDAVKSNWILASNGRVANNRAPKFTLGSAVEQSGNVTADVSADPVQITAAETAWAAANRAPPAPPAPPPPSTDPALVAAWNKAWAEIHTATLALRRAETAMQGLADTAGVPKP